LQLYFSRSFLFKITFFNTFYITYYSSILNQASESTKLSPNRFVQEGLVHIFFLANTFINKLLEFKNPPTECTMHKGGSECGLVRKPP